jgi:predicted deacylase/glutamine amidotransferase-like uncharacterized protein
MLATQTGLKKRFLLVSKMIFECKKHVISAQKLSLVAAVACSIVLPYSLASAKLSDPTAAILSSTNVLLSGTRFATPCYVQESGVPGPTIFIVGGVHGNEPAGANAAEVIRHWPLLKGKMVVIPRANVPGLAANKRLIPNLHTNLNNLNRNYPRAGKDEGPRGEPATAIWNLALKFKPDWLLDLHEGFDFHQVNENSVGSSVICYPNPKARAAADAMLARVNSEISVESLKFVRRDMPIDGSLARAAGEHLHIPSMTLETTSRQPMEKRIHQHEVLVHTLFQQLGMLGDSIPDQLLAAAQSQTATAVRAPRAAKLRVALYKGPGTGGEGPRNLMRRFDHAPDTSIAEVSPEDIRAGALTNYNVVIFGGGSGSKEAEAIGERGRSNVINFVANGGGYVGICAGAYLATSGYTWSLHLLNVKTVSPKWQRGRGEVKLEITDQGRKILQTRDKSLDCLYHNGPVVTTAEEASLPPYEALAYFRSEFASNGTPAGIMINSPALIAATYKKGRVVFCSPHPEQTTCLEEIIPHAVTWCSSTGDSEKIRVARDAAGQ